jgi:ribosomal protein L5
MPRIQDLQKMSAKGFDDANNYNFGIKRQDIFPEIDQIDHFFGMNITLKIRSLTKAKSLSLLQSLGFPFDEDSVNVVCGDKHAN